MEIKIFVGEDEAYRGLAENAFRPFFPKCAITMNENPVEGKIPLDYNVYLLHASHFNQDQVEDLRKEQPWCVIMLRTQNPDLIPYSHLERALPLDIDGFYGPSCENKNMKLVKVSRNYGSEDLGKECLKILSSKNPG